MKFEMMWLESVLLKLNSPIEIFKKIHYDSLSPVFIGK